MFKKYFFIFILIYSIVISPHFFIVPKIPGFPQNSHVFYDALKVYNPARMWLHGDLPFKEYHKLWLTEILWM